jgi:hypothetical protein
MKSFRQIEIENGVREQISILDVSNLPRPSCKATTHKGKGSSAKIGASSTKPSSNSGTSTSR